MLKIYVASFITEADYETMIDSSETREWTMEDFAQGFTCAAGTDRSRVVAKAQEMFISEWNDLEQAEHVASEFDFIVNLKNVDYIEVQFHGDRVGVIVIREFEEA